MRPVRSRSPGDYSNVAASLRQRQRRAPRVIAPAGNLPDCRRHGSTHGHDYARARQRGPVFGRRATWTPRSRGCSRKTDVTLPLLADELRAWLATASLLVARRAIVAGGGVEAGSWHSRRREGSRSRMSRRISLHSTGVRFPPGQSLPAELLACTRELRSFRIFLVRFRIPAALKHISTTG